VVFEGSSSENLAENNIFEHLRHSMLIQSAANGNVFGYNYSKDPFWVSSISNGAGDLTLHGNFPFCNLFEGNVGNNIVVDDSHALNGPNNIFFRNRAALWGIVMIGPNGSSLGCGDSTIFVGNEVSNLFTGYALFAGNGNYLYGNNVQGNCNPAGTQNIVTTSYYLKNSTPLWFSTGFLPTVGYPNMLAAGNIQATANYTNNHLTSCEEVKDTAISPPVLGVINIESGLGFYPNPCNNSLVIKNNTLLIASIKIYDLNGRLMLEQTATPQSIGKVSTVLLPSVFYMVKIVTANSIVCEKLIVLHD
jgi:Secretion system C-terminal sorting domain